MRSLRTNEDMSSYFRNNLAWQKSVALAVEIYRVCGSFPRYEQYGLAQQMRRASVSISSNIAEGRGRRTIPDRRQFVVQARGSAFELETQIEIARQLEYISRQQAMTLTEATNEVERLIHGLLRSLDSEE
jgi:four helix bundle protein